jgi:purine-binding chemotaxis protein CheW
MEELTVKSEITKYIVVTLGNEQFGIDIQYVDNIVRMQNCTRVPKTPKYINGVINLRGEIIPIMSARIKMGYETDAYTKNTRIIILKPEKGEQASIGVVVDQVKEVVNLENEQIEKIAYDKADKKPFAFGVGKRGNELISLLDVNVLISDDEITKEK